MVKLASARESRAYGPYPSRHRWEYINAGIYVFSTVLLAAGFAALLAPAKTPGLVVVLLALVLLSLVNAHDLLAHAAGIDYCLLLIQFDTQLALVEFAVPLVNFVGSALAFVAVLFLLIQAERGYRYHFEKHALNMLIAGPVFWVLGSIHNLCQIYERADGHTQMLQKAVQIPFLMGSLLFLVGGIFNSSEVHGSIQHEFKILGRSWVWLCLYGSLLLLMGGLLNLLKVFKMQQIDGLRLEKLRGGAQERLSREREGRVPLILEEDSRSRRATTTTRRSGGEVGPVPVPGTTTPYKDVLVGGGTES